MNINWFHPENVLARIERDNRTAYIPTLRQSLLIGCAGFTFASLLVFATVAFGERWMYRNLGLTGAYLLWTILFIAAGGAMLSPLVIGPGRLPRFYLPFGAAFFLYSVGWTGAYFTLRGTAGEWIGTLLGAVLMALAFGWTFRAWRSLPLLATVLFVCNAAGYFVGSIIFNSLPGQIGMVLWGLVYGLFFGVGIGAALFFAQARTRELLQQQSED